MKKSITLELTSEQYELLKSHADSQDKSISEFLCNFILYEAWIYESQHTASLQKLKRGLLQDGVHEWDEIKQRLDL